MILDLLRNLKQAALSHALSAAVVVQGVAVQQVTYDDFVATETHMISASEEQAQNFDQDLSEGEDRYWEDLNQLVSDNLDAQNLVGENSLQEKVAELYEPIPDEALLPADGPSSKPLVVQSTLNIPTLAPVSSSPSVEVASGERAPASTSKSIPVAAGSANNIVSPQDSNNDLNSSAKTIEESSKADQEDKKDEEIKDNKAVFRESGEVADDSQSSQREAEESSDSPQDESDQNDQGDDQDHLDQEGQEEEEEQESFNHLGTIALIIDGQVAATLLEDNAVLELDSNKEYSLAVVTEEDFGSVRFDLENIDTENLFSSQENHLPFLLNGDFGSINTPRPYSFEQASYQLDLTAYDSNGAGGDVLERRTLRFSISFTQGPSADDDDDDD
jgi:hypothetical protein